MKVAIVAGSKSDEEIMNAAREVLDEFGVTHKEFIASAHRSPNLTKEVAQIIEDEFDVAIVIAGLSAALPGVIAAYTNKPVLGVPVASDLMGLDALFSIAQMPRGIPVATFGIGKKGAKNAALFAIRILSLKNPTLLERLKDKARSEEEELRKLNDM
ncbi:5-(carboxyamino)imidazole ribonucleotide mutase [Hippea maritima]|uniref:N5-carboxyaminoimidazole ribonucleotide mutase n=1 Tax=Hippea maritima (strain ATCC 700847 / DSM 10411 / MH2) TaxID=760142 RepID=F2LVE5_HIPMA|nr:5-(carboxyamino)imidazole ribonucleotide mutase [Hippea maritima]AEA33729.1 phosphoribosylaminoimidazole carboxylase, catalytic subunit [Hippea maritima DSM 10411]